MNEKKGDSKKERNLIEKEELGMAMSGGRTKVRQKLRNQTMVPDDYPPLLRRFPAPATARLKRECCFPSHPQCPYKTPLQ